jgi:hypothetical protein
MADVRTPSTALILSGAHALVLFLPPARANEVAFVVISNLRDVPGEQSLKKIKSSAESESSLSVGVSKF